MKIKKTKIREAVNLNVSENFYKAFDDKVSRLLEDASDRAKKAGRATLMERDA